MAVVLSYLKGRGRSLRREKVEVKTPSPPPLPIIGNSGNKKIGNPGPGPPGNHEFTYHFRTFPVFGDLPFLLPL